MFYRLKNITWSILHFQLKKTLHSLKQGKKVEVPIYNFVTHRRNEKTVSMYGANVLIFEGILSFHDKDILDMLDMKIFVDTDSDIRLTRRLTRDISQRGRDLKVGLTIKEPEKERLKLGVAQHRGSIHYSLLAAPGLILSVPFFYLDVAEICTTLLRVVDRGLNC